MCPRIVCSAKLLMVMVVGWPSLGCGDTEGRFSLSGTVTYDGQPINNGNIGFIVAGSSTGKSVGADVIDGHYEIPRHEGPQAGAYKVMIYAERPSGRKIEAEEGSTEMIDQLVQYIPDVYNDRTTLTIELSSDRDDLNFDLEKPKQVKRRRR